MFSLTVHYKKSFNESFKEHLYPKYEVKNNEIYHFTYSDKVLKVLEEGLKIMDYGYVSFTANPHLNFGDVLLTFDYKKLNRDYRLEKFHYGIEEIPSDEATEEEIREFDDEQEYVSKAPIPKIIKYLTCITILSKKYITDETLQLLTSLCEKNNIPLHIETKKV